MTSELDPEVVSKVVIHLFDPLQPKTRDSIKSLISPTLDIQFNSFLTSSSSTSSKPSQSKPISTNRHSPSAQALSLFRLPGVLINQFSSGSWELEVVGCQEIINPPPEEGENEEEKEEEEREGLKRWKADLEWIFNFESDALGKIPLVGTKLVNRKRIFRRQVELFFEPISDFNCPQSATPSAQEPITRSEVFDEVNQSSGNPIASTSKVPIPTSTDASATPDTSTATTTPVDKKHSPQKAYSSKGRKFGVVLTQVNYDTGFKMPQAVEAIPGSGFATEICSYLFGLLISPLYGILLLLGLGSSTPSFSPTLRTTARQREQKRKEQQHLQRTRFLKASFNPKSKSRSIELPLSLSDTESDSSELDFSTPVSESTYHYFMRSIHETYRLFLNSLFDLKQELIETRNEFKELINSYRNLILYTVESLMVGFTAALGWFEHSVEEAVKEGEEISNRERWLMERDAQDALYGDGRVARGDFASPGPEVGTFEEFVIKHNLRPPKRVSFSFSPSRSFQSQASSTANTPRRAPSGEPFSSVGYSTSSYGSRPPSSPSGGGGFRTVSSRTTRKSKSHQDFVMVPSSSLFSDSFERDYQPGGKNTETYHSVEETVDVHSSDEDNEDGTRGRGRGRKESSTSDNITRERFTAKGKFNSGTGNLKWESGSGSKETASESFSEEVEHFGREVEIGRSSGEVIEELPDDFEFRIKREDDEDSNSTTTERSGTTPTKTRPSSLSSRSSTHSRNDHLAFDYLENTPSPGHLEFDTTDSFRDEEEIPERDRGEEGESSRSTKSFRRDYKKKDVGDFFPSRHEFTFDELAEIEAAEEGRGGEEGEGEDHQSQSSIVHEAALELERNRPGMDPFDDTHEEEVKIISETTSGSSTVDGDQESRERGGIGEKVEEGGDGGGNVGLAEKEEMEEELEKGKISSPALQPFVLFPTPTKEPEELESKKDDGEKEILARPPPFESNLPLPTNKQEQLGRLQEEEEEKRLTLPSPLELASPLPSDLTSTDSTESALLKSDQTLKKAEGEGEDYTSSEFSLETSSDSPLLTKKKKEDLKKGIEEGFRIEEVEEEEEGKNLKIEGEEKGSGMMEMDRPVEFGVNVKVEGKEEKDSSSTGTATDRQESPPLPPVVQEEIPTSAKKVKKKKNKKGANKNIVLSESSQVAVDSLSPSTSTATNVKGPTTRSRSTSLDSTPVPPPPTPATPAAKKLPIPEVEEESLSVSPRTSTSIGGANEGSVGKGSGKKNKKKGKGGGGGGGR